MRKAKIGIFCALVVALVGLGLIFAPVGVKASDDDLSSQWELPESVKQFVEADGRGVRLYISFVYDGVDDGEFSGELEYAKVRSFRESYEEDGFILKKTDYIVGSDYFDFSVFFALGVAAAAGLISEGVALTGDDRIFVYFDVEKQVFCYEGAGLSYYDYWMSKYFDLAASGGGGYEEGYEAGYDAGYVAGFGEGESAGYDEGYQTGYDEGLLEGDYQEGYQVGYQDGFIDGEKSKIAKNNETFYKNIAIWIPAAISLIALASIISIFGIKRKNE